MLVVPGEITWTDDFGVVHTSEVSSVVSTCGRAIIRIDNPVLWHDPPQPVTCLFCLAGGDVTWKKLQETLRLMEQYGVTVDRVQLDKIEASL